MRLRSADALLSGRLELIPIRSVEMMGRMRLSLFRNSCKRRRKRSGPNGRAEKFACALALAVSSFQPVVAEEGDPFEANNRLFHNFNVAVDRFVYRPVAHAYGIVTPGVVMQGISNMSSNLSVPGIVLNNILQLDVDSALINTARFAINTTIGVGGVLDVAAGLGMRGQKNRFRGDLVHLRRIKRSVSGAPSARTEQRAGRGGNLGRACVQSRESSAVQRCACGRGVGERVGFSWCSLHEFRFS